MLEECVADCKSFINDQHQRRGKKFQWQSESDIHTAGVSLKRLVNEVADLGETFDYLERLQSKKRVRHHRSQ
jgi:hypothetical protein